MTIQFFFPGVKIDLPNRTRLKKFIRGVFSEKGKDLKSLTYIFCTDEFLLDINRRFLKHNYYTDIITFNLSETADTIDGEIYISVDRVRENARELDISIKDELHRVVFHGALHLCGYKDKKPREMKIMRAQEDRYLASYFA